MTFSIRRACREDANFVLELFTLPHVREFTHGPKSIEVFVNALERGDRELLIIDRGGRPFGHLVIAVLDGWLMEIRVIAFEEQRTGAGRFSMEWLLHRAFEDLGLHRIFLEVVESNTGAQALYERVGFLREGCYRDGYRADDGTFTISYRMEYSVRKIRARLTVRLVTSAMAAQSVLKTTQFRDLSTC